LRREIKMNVTAFREALNRTLDRIPETAYIAAVQRTIFSWLAFSQSQAAGTPFLCKF
jgi:hypothetical protein